MNRREIRKLVEHDGETESVAVDRLARRIRIHGSRRLTAIGERVLAGEDGAIELYLRELFSNSMRQVKASLCLFTTFTKNVEKIPPPVRKLLPQGFGTLVRLAKEPFPVENPKHLARALVVDGKFNEWLRSQATWRTVLDVPDGGLADARKAYQKRRKETHPDIGGDAEQFREVQRAWAQAQQELGHQ